MIKKTIIFLLVMIPLAVIVSNFNALINPNEELFKTLCADQPPKWKVELLIGLGAEISYRNGASYEAMLTFKNYEFIELFAKNISNEEKNDMYEIAQRVEIPPEIDLRIRSSLGIK